MRKRRDDKELAAIASKYDVLKEFIAEPQPTRLFRAYGLFDELCGRMKREVIQNQSDEEFEAIASNYTDLKDL